ncbi:DUF6932 family protein [Erwinia persicina]|uniref:Uncharacterized protein n=1 Tax=Erwinia persicina TaxID=55211 RepID=A0A4V5UAQ4_9GAMM|nr:hypothetical protein [Erwinia persicina]TKJ94567.1 hypothetical protein EpCFBP13511_03205 [Erwinia persicina]
MDKICFPPLLPAGFHDLDDTELEALCVNSFPASARRSRLHCNFIQLVALLREINLQFKCFGEIWVDGSYTTQKPEPYDIDILLVIDYAALMKIPEEQLKTVSPLLNRSFVKANYDIDVLLLPENHPDVDYSERRSYWRGWFGFDRRENPKGLVRFAL